MFVGLGRVLSGEVRRGDKLYLIRGDKSELVSVEGVYLMMGQYLEGVESLGAGNILGLRFEEKAGVVFKSGTLSSRQDCCALNIRGEDQKSMGLLKVKVTVDNMD